MWSLFVKHWGYHHHNRKWRLKWKLFLKGEPYIRPRQRLLSYVRTLWLLLLISSVRVATLAMQPRMVELWKCQAEHLRQYYSYQKIKQKGQYRPIYSSQFSYYSMLIKLWIVVVSSEVLLALNLDTVMSTICKSM